MKITVEDDLGILVARDGALPCPEAIKGGGRESRAHLKELARNGDVFFVDREDPIKMSVQVVADDKSYREVPTELYRTIAGNYLLNVPSGSLEVEGLGSWIGGNPVADGPIRLEAGAYSVEALEFEDHDLSEYEAYMSKLVGEDNWAFRNRVDLVYFLGCLPTVIAVAIAFLFTWKFGLYTLPAVVVLWLPYIVLKRSKRYRSVEKIVSETERGWPQFILRLRKLESAQGAIGGYI